MLVVQGSRCVWNIGNRASDGAVRHPSRLEFLWYCVSDPGQETLLLTAYVCFFNTNMHRKRWELSRQWQTKYKKKVKGLYVFIIMNCWYWSLNPVLLIFSMCPFKSYSSTAARALFKYPQYDTCSSLSYEKYLHLMGQCCPHLSVESKYSVTLWLIICIYCNITAMCEWRKKKNITQE
jgi:hypothetical protein